MAPPPTTDHRIPRRPLDDVDRALVELLSTDGRMPNAEARTPSPSQTYTTSSACEFR